MTAIPTWIKPGALARYAITDQVVEVQKVHADGFALVRGPRSNGLIQSPPGSLKPATIEDRILYALAAARINEIKSILPEGKAEDHFRIQFQGHIAPAAIDKMTAIVPDIFLDAQLDGDAYIVTIKPSWLAELVAVDPVTPALLAQAQAEAEALIGKVAEQAAVAADAPAADDIDLAEAARIIKELRERNDRLQARNEALAEQVDSLIGHIDSTALHAEAAAERDETPVSASQLTTCKEWDIALAASIADLNTRESQGWEVAHMEFELGKLNVVYYRVQSTPAPANGSARTGKLIESSSPVVTFTVPADSHGAQHRKPVPTVTLNQHGAPPIRYEQIAADRVRLQALVNDPDVTDFDFSLAVEQSRLPRDERNALIRQYRNQRTGQRLAAQMDQMPRPAAQRPFVSLGEVQR